MDFSNDIVIVTGSSRGIGKSIAYEFAKLGASVMLTGSLDKVSLNKTYQDFKDEGFHVDAYLGDLSVYTCAKALFEQTLHTFGAYPSILINNAGISHVGLFTDTDPLLWTKVINTNLHSAYYCSYLAVPHMIQEQSGIIVNISSIWGSTGASCEVAYSTSKSALNGLTKSLAKELGPSSIRVNAIACGWIDTEMNQHFSEEDKQSFIDNIPLGRAGVPLDVSQACLFLASKNASYLTGQVIHLDGGLL